MHLFLVRSKGDSISPNSRSQKGEIAILVPLAYQSALSITRTSYTLQSPSILVLFTFSPPQLSSCSWASLPPATHSPHDAAMCVSRPRHPPPRLPRLSVYWPYLIYFLCSGFLQSHMWSLAGDLPSNTFLLGDFYPGSVAGNPSALEGWPAMGALLG